MCCDNCNQMLTVCDNCGKSLVEFACLSVKVTGQAAQQLAVPDGTDLSRPAHYCRKCCESLFGNLTAH